MILAEDVRDMNGRRLLTAGTDLNQKGLQILKTWGITEVAIESDGVAPRPEEESLDDPTLFRETRDLFSLVDTKNSLMNELVHESIRVRRKRPYDTFLVAHGEPPPLQRSSLPRSPSAVAETGSYATLPEVYKHILSVIDNPRSSAVDISDAVVKDPSFTSRLLNLANSSYYALKKRVDTVSMAVSVIGTRQLGTLALGISVSRSLLSLGQESFSMVEFWRHSVATAVAARTLAIYLKEKNTERFFIGGLLHDLGKVLLYSQLNDAVFHIAALCRSHKLNQFAVEQNLLGFTHADVGHEVCRLMNLPDNLHSMISDHHSVGTSLRPFDAAVIHLADIIVNGIKKGASGEPRTPPLQNEAADQLSLPAGGIEEVVRQVEAHTDEVGRIMFDG